MQGKRKQSTGPIIGFSNEGMDAEQTVKKTMGCSIGHFEDCYFISLVKDTVVGTKV